MDDFDFHLSVNVEQLPSIVTLLNEWKSTLLQGRYSLILSSCEISGRKSLSSKPILTLTIVCEPHIISEGQIQEDLAPALVNLELVEIYRTLKTSSAPSLSPTLE